MSGNELSIFDSMKTLIGCVALFRLIGIVS